MSGPRIVAVSHKLYFDTARAVGYCTGIASALGGDPAITGGQVTVALLPSFLAIPAVSDTVHAAGLRLGAQDVGPEDRGAFTGEVSATDLRDAGCSVAEVGHAERRALFGETDAMIRAKVAACLRNELTPLLCLGEPERTSPARAAEVCIADALAATGGSTDAEIWLAYEPVWAIGAPAPAPADYVREVCGRVRERLASDLPRLSILYGGSAGPGLLEQLHPAVDGLFLGRFAHDPEAFLSVVREASALGD